MLSFLASIVAGVSAAVGTQKAMEHPKIKPRLDKARDYLGEKYEQVQATADEAGERAAEAWDHMWNGKNSQEEVSEEAPAKKVVKLNKKGRK